MPLRPPVPPRRGPRPSAAAIATAVLASLFLAGASAAAVPAAQEPAAAGAPAAPAVRFIGVDEIRPGMQGKGRTVFQGNTLEEFDVEILGVLQNAIGPQQDMILARLHGDKVEFTGVVAGMSGSPVYIDGRLAGALSYRIGNFTKEAIAGITPIRDMIRLAETGPVTAEVVAPDRLGRFLAEAAAPGGGALPAEPVTAQAQMRPIGVPLVCTGCDAGVLRYYAPIFAASGLEPVAGGGVAGAGEPIPLVPGSPIGAALITGDLSVVGIGTLTYVDGKRAFAFGHPMLGTGKVEMPMVQARVLLTLASNAGSFKIANSTPPVGTVVSDGLTAIVGEVGRSAATIPVTVAVKAPGGRSQYRFEVLRERSWSPVLVAAATANSLVRSLQYDASATLSLRSRIVLDGYPEVDYEDLYSGTNPQQPVHISLANDVGGLFGLLVNNRFEETRVRSATIEVEVLKEAQVGAVSSLRASRTEVRPGDTVTVTALVRPFRGDERPVTWDLTIPEDTMPGDLEIIVGGGPAIDGLDRRILERQLAQAAGLADLVRLANHQRQSRMLYLRLTRRAPAAVVRSEILPDLPLSVFSVLNNPRLSAEFTLMGDAPLLEIGKDAGVAVIGGRRISVRVK